MPLPRPSWRARFGFAAATGSSCTMRWAEKNSRPSAPRDRRYAWACLFGAVCPARQVTAALVLPFADAATMNLHLAEISRQVGPGAHAVLILDGAGWHKTGGRLRVPDTITLLHLHPYAPELKPVENIWAYLRANKLANTLWENYDAVVDACCAAWNWFANSPDAITTIASRSSAKVHQ